MNVQDVTSLITSVGFPIFACCAIYYALFKEQENHKTEVSDLKKVISDINETLSALKQLIEDKLK